MLHKIYTKDTNTLLYEIDQVYKKNNFCIVNFLYFANAIQYDLFALPEDQKHSLHNSYEKALLHGDFLLPDGIALQIWHYYNYKPKTWIHNLNGTDFTPHALEYFSKKYKVHLYVYSLYDDNIGKSQEWLEKGVHALSQKYAFDTVHSYQSAYQQRGHDYPWHDMQSVVSKDPSVCNIFLNCTGTPFQEMRVEEHKERFVKNNMLVMNVGGFIDFVSGFEKRAPKRVVKARVLETFWRVASNPKKNFKKFAAMFGVVSLLWKKNFTSSKNKNSGK